MKVNEFEKDGISFEFELDGSEGLKLGAGHLGSRQLGDGNFSIMWMPEGSDTPIFITAATAVLGGYGRMVRNTKHCERNNLIKVIRKIQKLSQLSHWHSVKV